MKYVVLVSHGTFAPGLHSVLKMLAGGEREDVISVGLEDGMPYTVFGVVGVIVSVVCVLLCVIIGLGLKRGRENVDKIIKAAGC